MKNQQKKQNNYEYKTLTVEKFMNILREELAKTTVQLEDPSLVIAGALLIKNMHEYFKTKL